MGNMEKRQRQVIREMGASTVPIHLCNTSLKPGFINKLKGALKNQLRGIIRTLGGNSKKLMRGRNIKHPGNSSIIVNSTERRSPTSFIKFLTKYLYFVLSIVSYFVFSNMFNGVSINLIGIFALSVVYVLVNDIYCVGIVKGGING